jgi:hypothetical protein
MLNKALRFLLRVSNKFLANCWVMVLPPRLSPLAVESMLVKNE